MLKVEMKEINSIVGAVNGIYREAARKLGVSDSELNILYMIYDQGEGCRQSTICRMTNLPRTTVNSSLRRLEKTGMIYLKQGEGRNTLIYLTPRGSEHMKSTAERLVAAENAFYTRWTAEEREQFTALYRRFAQDLAAEVEKI